MDRKTLDEMSQMDIRTIDRTTLVDIRNVEVNPDEPIAERMKKYLRDIKNPYCFRVGDTPVQVVFNENGKTLSETFRNHLKNY